MLTMASVPVFGLAQTGVAPIARMGFLEQETGEAICFARRTKTDLDRAVRRTRKQASFRSSVSLIFHDEIAIRR